MRRDCEPGPHAISIRASRARREKGCSREPRPSRWAAIAAWIDCVAILAVSNWQDIARLPVIEASGTSEFMKSSQIRLSNSLKTRFFLWLAHVGQLVETGARRPGHAASDFRFRPEILVPTLRVGMALCEALRRVKSGTPSLPEIRPHAEWGNEEDPATLLQSPTGGVFDTQESVESLHCCPLYVVAPLEDRYVLVAVLLVHPPEWTQEVPLALTYSAWFARKANKTSSEAETGLVISPFPVFNAI